MEVGLTIKSIDYFSMGLPIVNNIKGDTWKMVDEYDLGINVSSTDDAIERIAHRDNSDRNIVFDFFEKTFTIESYRKKIKTIIANVSV